MFISNIQRIFVLMRQNSIRKAARLATYHYRTRRMHQCLQLIQITLSLRKEREKEQITKLRLASLFIKPLLNRDIKNRKHFQQIRSVLFTVAGVNTEHRFMLTERQTAGVRVLDHLLHLVPLSLHDVTAELGGRGVLQPAARLLHEEVNRLTVNNPHSTTNITAKHQQ